MSNKTEKTLFIPDLINIEFRDQNDNPLYQENILVGIKTIASHKNNINISPFVSDKKGHLRITKDQVNKRADNFIAYGLMDYAPLEYAKPEVKLYFWGNKNINIYLGYEIHPEVAKTFSLYMPNFDMDDYKKQVIEQKKQEKDYLIFAECFNRSTKIADDVILTEDIWDKPQSDVFYKVKIPV